MLNKKFYVIFLDNEYYCSFDRSEFAHKFNADVEDVSGISNLGSRMYENPLYEYFDYVELTDEVKQYIINNGMKDWQDINERKQILGMSKKFSDKCKRPALALLIEMLTIRIDDCKFWSYLDGTEYNNVKRIINNFDVAIKLEKQSGN